MAYCSGTSRLEARLGRVSPRGLLGETPQGDSPERLSGVSPRGVSLGSLPGETSRRVCAGRLSARTANRDQNLQRHHTLKFPELGPVTLGAAAHRSGPRRGPGAGRRVSERCASECWGTETNHLARSPFWPKLGRALRARRAVAQRPFLTSPPTSAHSTTSRSSSARNISKTRGTNASTK